MKIFWYIKLLSVFLLGSFHWEMPRWFYYLTTPIRLLFRGIAHLHRTHTKPFYAGVLVLCCMAGGGIWYAMQPQPEMITVNVSRIQPTPLEKEAAVDTLWLSFSNSAARLDDIGKSVSKGIRMSPNVEGEWVWKNDYTLVFTPKKDWPVGERLDISMDKSLFPSHVRLESYEYQAKTPSFSYEIKKTSFYQNPKNPKEKKVVAEVHFTHPVNPDMFEKRVEFSFIPTTDKKKNLKPQPIKFDVSYDEFHGKAYLHTQNLPIPNYNSTMTLRIAKGVKSSRGGEAYDEEKESDTVVPGMLSYFTFKPASTTIVRNTEYEPEQALIISATASMTQEDLSKYMEVYMLPKDCPAMGNRPAEEECYWQAKTVTNKALSLATKLDLEPVPTEHEYAKTITYKYEANPQTYVFVRIKKGLQAFGGYTLAKDASFVFRVPDYPTEVSIMSKGSLLSVSGDKKLPIMARNLKHVRYTAKRLLPKQIAHFVTQTYGSMEQPNFRNYALDFDNLTETFTEVRALPRGSKGKSQYSYFDFATVMQAAEGTPKGLFYFTAEGWDKEHETTEPGKDSRFILITDLGIIAKKANDGSRDIFVQSIASGKPVMGATVDVIGKNGLSVISRTTDTEGHVSFPDLKDFKQEKTPTVFVVSKGDDLSFIPVSSHKTDVNYSKFEIGGEMENQGIDELNTFKTYFFSDRGIYRPGETVNLGYIVKDIDWGQDLSNVPTVMYVSDPKGTRMIEKTGMLSALGLQEFQIKTDETWQTGSYRVNLYAKRPNRDVYLGSTSVWVEEFVPDRMKITAKFSELAHKGWVHPDALTGIVSLQNLFGTPAQDRRVNATLSLTPAYHSFAGYRDWQFYDPMRSKKSFSENLGSMTTDDDGKAVFDLHLNNYDALSYALSFVAEGFEAEGGRSVIATNSVIVSPLDYIVGYKAEGTLRYVKKDAEIGVKVLALNPSLETVALEGLKTKLVEIKNVSTLVEQPNGTFKYETVRKEYPLTTEDFAIQEKDTRIALNTKKAGEYALLIVNAEGTELNRVSYSVAGEGNVSFAMEKNAELQVKLDKSSYQAGDTIELSLKAPYVGSGLITIERDKVYAYKWFTATHNSSVHTITIPEELEGNAYVNIAFVRSLDSDEIFMSPLSSAVVPFSIDRNKRVNKITLEVPELVRPNEELRIQVSAKNKGKAIVFAVDEGILQFAKYQTPNPLAEFYQKKALQVETRQILDLILPEFSKLYRRELSEAGGYSKRLVRREAIARNLNPFGRVQEAPVAYWSGVVDVSPETKELTYHVPDYFAGNLRVIAVAVSEEAMDATSRDTLVRGPFVLSPNVPRFVAPNDTFTVSVGISNNIEKSGKAAPVSLTLKTDKGLTVVGDAQQTLAIDEGGEASVTFTLKAGNVLGSTSLMFEAVSGEEKGTRMVATGVRPAAPYRTLLKAGSVKKGKRVSVDTAQPMYPEFYTGEVVVAKTPIHLIPSLKLYLEKYPHGCSEQIVSAAFPGIILSPYSSVTERAKVAEQVEGMSELLASRQLPSGGVAQWPGSNEVSNFHTVYAAHYLTEAQSLGFNVRKELMQAFVWYLSEYAKREPEDLNMARVQAYAAYVLARNGVVVGDALTTLSEWRKDYDKETKDQNIMVLYMAGAYKMMQADEKAEALLKRFDFDAEPDADDVDYEYGVFDESIRKSTYIYMMAKHFPERLRNVKIEELEGLLTKLTTSYNTTSAAMGILALDAYTKSKDSADMSDVIGQTKIGETLSALTWEGKPFPSASFAREADTLLLKNNSDDTAFYSIMRAGFEATPSTKAEQHGIEVSRRFVNEDGEELSKVALGEEVFVEVRMRSIDAKVPNVAVIDLLPGGFEVVLDSIKRNRQCACFYEDVREDRVLLYRTLRDGVSTYRYRIKATNKGRYTVPAIYAESMYDKAIWSTGASSDITVE